MTDPSEVEFTRLWKGVGHEVDMRKVMEQPTRPERLNEFRNELQSMPSPANRLGNLKQTNLEKFFGTSVILRTDVLKAKAKQFKGKEKLTDNQKEVVEELQLITGKTARVSEKRFKVGKKARRLLKREELVSSALKDVGAKFKRKKKIKTGKRGRPPSTKAVEIFETPRTVTGKTGKTFNTHGIVRLETRTLHIIEANIRTGKTRYRNAATGRFAKL